MTLSLSLTPIAIPGPDPDPDPIFEQAFPQLADMQARFMVKAFMYSLVHDSTCTVRKHLQKLRKRSVQVQHLAASVLQLAGPSAYAQATLATRSGWRGTQATLSTRTPKAKSCEN